MLTKACIPAVVVALLVAIPGVAPSASGLITGSGTAESQDVIAGRKKREFTTPHGVELRSQHAYEVRNDRLRAVMSRPPSSGPALVGNDSAASAEDRETGVDRAVAAVSPAPDRVRRFVTVQDAAVAVLLVALGIWTTAKWLRG